MAYATDAGAGLGVRPRTRRAGPDVPALRPGPCGAVSAARRRPGGVPVRRRQRVGPGLARRRDRRAAGQPVVTGRGGRRTGPARPMKVCVVGGGIAGSLLAWRLAQRPTVAVTLV